MSPFTAGELFSLKDLVEYKPGEASKKFLVNLDDFKMVLISIDHGTLPAHPAPMNALLTCLEGSASLTYEGKECTIACGQSFAFDKGGMHLITTEDKAKFALLLFA